MSGNQVQDLNMNRNVSTRSNFTFAPGSHQPSFYPGQSLHYDAENPASPRFNNQAQPFNIAYTMQNPGARVRDLLEKLNGGGYVCYKYFVVIIAVLQCFEGLVSLFGWAEASGAREFFLLFFQTITILWKGYALGLEWKAIDSKDYDYARRAVLMMQWYMVMVALLVGASASEKNVVIDMQGVQLDSLLGSYTLLVIAVIAVEQLVFYLLYLFGALKVRNTLDEVNKLLGRRNTEPLL